MNATVIKKDLMLKYHGYNEDVEPLVPSQELYFFIHDLAYLDKWRTKPKISINFQNKRKTKQDAQDFFKRHFRLHKIPYKRLTTGLDLFFLDYISDVKTATTLCNATNLHINPFSLPVLYTGENETDTMVIENATILDDEDFYKKVEISFNSIILRKYITEMSSASYVHEITHTQLTKKRGIVKEYFNSEVLPIFIELLYVYETGNKDLLLLTDVVRINELINHINLLYTASLDGVRVEESALLNNSVYTESIIKAYMLFIEYIDGSPPLKKYILKTIQNIFDGNLQLEELLDEFEIDKENQYESRRLIKYFNREN